MKQSFGKNQFRCGKFATAVALGRAVSIHASFILRMHTDDHNPSGGRKNLMRRAVTSVKDEMTRRTLFRKERGRSEGLAQGRPFWTVKHSSALTRHGR